MAWLIDVLGVLLVLVFFWIMIGIFGSGLVTACIYADNPSLKNDLPMPTTDERLIILAAILGPFMLIQPWRRTKGHLLKYGWRFPRAG